MKTDILVIPVVVVPAVKNLTVAPLQTPDKIQGLYDWSVRFGEVLGGVTAETFVNDGLHIVRFCVPVVLPELLY